MNGIIKRFIDSKISGGILLVFATFCALVFQNLDFTHDLYNSFINYEFNALGHLVHHDQTTVFWINEFLMPIYFFMVGLELKREILIGQLKRFSQVFLPSFAAIGGVITPAIIYFALNHGDPFAARGWAIPTTTDIAFSLGVITLLGSRVPLSLKMFLLTAAIMDDIYAILIIAFFYSSTLGFFYLFCAALTVGGLILLNSMHVKSMIPFIVLSLLLWFFTLNSGIHPTVAGVIAAFCIPLSNLKTGYSMLIQMEHALLKPINLLLLPLFAFVNAGVYLKGMDLNLVLHPVSVGIMVGLFFGKQFGIFCFSWILIKLKLAKLPEGSDFLQLYGLSIVFGIGFTMALFVGDLSFSSDPSRFMQVEKLAILIVSLISGVAGYLFIRFVSSKNIKPNKTQKLINKLNES